jgi:anti-sigma factor RsiW
MSGRDGSGFSNASCADVSALLVFYVCEEVSDAERDTVEAHVADCSACAAQLVQERSLYDAVAATAQPADLLDRSGVLLAQCRSELLEKLDDVQAVSTREPWHPFRWARHWMALHPAWSAACLVIFGVALGTQILPWIQTANDVAGPAVNVLAAPKLTDEQLSKMAVDSVHVSPATGQPGENIQLRLSAEQPLELSGNVDDREMRRVLTFAVQNSDRSDVGVRLDCIDILKKRIDDEQVRAALLRVVRTDPSAAMRIKSLEALRDSADDTDVRDTMLQVLNHDASPGVRVAAVNLLVRSLQRQPLVEADGVSLSNPAENGNTQVRDASDKSALEAAVRALTELELHDPNSDVRLRSAAALRQIAGRPQP